MRNQQNPPMNKRQRRSSLKKDYDELLNQLEYRERMIKNLEESESQFATEKVRYELLYNNAAAQIKAYEDLVKAQEKKYEIQIAEMKSDIRLFKVGIQRMIEDAESINSNFKRYKDLMNTNIDKYD